MIGCAQPPRPGAYLPVNAAGIPDAMRDVPQWVAWRAESRGKGKPAKVPLDPRTLTPARVTDPGTWGRLDDAVAAYARHRLTGIGFVLAPAGGVAAVDLDGVRDPASGAVEPFALDLIREPDSFAEVSPSGTGAHVFAGGRLDPGGPNRRGPVEVYDRARFVAVTGHRIPGAPAGVEPRDEALGRLQDRLRPPGAPRPVGPAAAGGGFDGPDAELLRVAFAAANGERTRRYWDGDRCGKASPSEALLGLAQLLAFYTGPDEGRLDRLLRGSPLLAASEAQRAKWDSGRPGGTWGMVCVVRKAIATCARFYTPPAGRPPTNTPNRVSNGVQLGGRWSRRGGGCWRATSRPGWSASPAARTRRSAASSRRCVGTWRARRRARSS